MKEYKCRRIETNIIIDGNLDKPEWKFATGIKLVDTVTGCKPRLDSYVKLLWNNDFLYVCFYCEDDYVCASMTGYNDKIYEEDVIELFIDDNRDMKTYIEIEVNPLNALLHYSIHNNLKGGFSGFAKVEKTIKTAVRTSEELWTAEMSIPLNEFVTAKNIPPKHNDKWRINLYRIDRSEKGEDAYSAWSPTGKVNFHMPEKFGSLVFCE